MRAAPIEEISDTIKCRGMQTMLAGNIKGFLQYAAAANARRGAGPWATEAPWGLGEVAAMGGMLAAVERAAGEGADGDADEEVEAAVEILLDALVCSDEPGEGGEGGEGQPRRCRRRRSPALLEYEAEEGPASPGDTPATPSSDSHAASELLNLYEQHVKREDGAALSLEWLREAPDDEARDFLMGVNGLGRKSVACIMLLTLGKKEFPVDVNVSLYGGFCKGVTALVLAYLEY